ncbi:MAG: substrate-binding domain-containing protein [Candidatus Bathyarchaeota archaeon]|nr:substrate-binding domain-containing protein [Candidatus Bathyarchaeota archaeon]
MNIKKMIVSIALISMIIAAMFMALPVQALQSGIDSTIASNQVKIRGSSTVYPISLEAKTAFEAANPGKTIVLPEAEGSGTGLDALTQISTSTIGTDIAAASKIPDSTNPLTTSSQRNYWNTSILMSNGASNDFGMADLRIWPIGKDSIAIIVDKQNPYYSKVSQLTVQQVADVFCVGTTPGVAKYPTWKSFVQAIGGDTTGMGDEAINLVTRVLNSGTHDGFKTFFLTPAGKSDSNLAPHQEKAENQDVLDTVSNDPYALAYIGLGFLEDHPSLINGIAIGYGSTPVYVTPTKAHVLDNTYCYAANKPIYRWLWYATNGLPMKNTDGALKTDFINWVKIHPEYVDHAGYIRMLKSDFCGATPAFASQDSAPVHSSIPDDKVNAADITYFVLAYIAQYDSSRPTINPLCDYNGDRQINAADITQFVLGYIGYYNGGGF